MEGTQWWWPEHNSCEWECKEILSKHKELWKSPGQVSIAVLVEL